MIQFIAIFIQFENLISILSEVLEDEHEYWLKFRLSVDKFGLLTIPQRNHEQALWVLWVQKECSLT